jgi:hypothetical protein
MMIDNYLPILSLTQPVTASSHRDARRRAEKPSVKPIEKTAVAGRQGRLFLLEVEKKDCCSRRSLATSANRIGIAAKCLKSSWTNERVLSERSSALKPALVHPASNKDILVFNEVRRVQ